ncbi:hypothetical protein VitviT2T_028355 [Vitis vinifera]|uniref:Uncharacterized protein n=1 Tax=Vitis vinifera TaxID=29760 RepID=A0ABY9DVZ2_VITVI|nr:hypothetical protein VitviT2T_028355 [Vitis vinifera]
MKHCNTLGCRGNAMKVGFLDKIDPGMQIIALLGDAYEATSSLCLLETLTACHQVHLPLEVFPLQDQKVEIFSSKDLISRLTLTIDTASIGPLPLSDSFITQMGTNDYCSIPQQLKDHKCKGSYGTGWPTERDGERTEKVDSLTTEAERLKTSLLSHTQSKEEAKAISAVTRFSMAMLAAKRKRVMAYALAYQWQHRKSDLELDLTTLPQASVDDSSWDSEELELSWSALVDEVVRQNQVSMDSEITTVSSSPDYQQYA